MCWVSDPYDSVVSTLYIPATREGGNGWSVNLSRGGEVAGTRPVEIGEFVLGVYWPMRGEDGPP